MTRIECSCGGENERCYKCDGRGWYGNADPDKPLQLPRQNNSTSVTATTNDTKRPQGKRRRIFLDNPLPPRAIPPERRQKYGTVDNLQPQKPIGPRTRVSLLLDDQEFACSYPVGLVTDADLLDVAFFLVGTFVLSDRDFLKTHHLRKLVIAARDRGTAFVETSAGALEKYVVVKNRRPVFVCNLQVFHSDLLARKVGGKTHRGRPGVQVVSESNSKARLPLPEGNESAPSSAESDSRALDATRDHWRLRDHGQFGSSPSYDDYDE